MDEKLKEKFAEDVFNILCRWKSDEMRRCNKYGASLSHVKELMAEMGWRGLGGTWDFEMKLNSVGFRAVPTLLKGGVEHKYNRAVSI